MKSLAPLLLSLLLPLLLAGCTVPIEIHTDDSDPVVVISGTLCDLQQYQYVSVGLSTPYFSDEPNPVVNNANVWVESSDGQVIPFRLTVTAGLYGNGDNTPMIITPGVAYTLHVEVDSNDDGIEEHYTAVSTPIEAIEIDSMKMRPFNIMGREFYSADIYAQDPPSADYYLALFQLNGRPINDQVSKRSIMDDNLFNGQYMQGISLQFMDVRPDEGDGYFVRPGDDIFLWFCRIERGYYNFINQCQEQLEGEVPFFGGPPSNITTNLTGGAVGYFAVYCASSTSAVVGE